MQINYNNMTQCLNLHIEEIAALYKESADLPEQQLSIINPSIFSTMVETGVSLVQFGSMIQCIRGRNGACTIQNTADIGQKVVQKWNKGESWSEKAMGAMKVVCDVAANMGTPIALTQCFQRKWTWCAAGLVGSTGVAYGCNMLPDSIRE